MSVISMKSLLETGVHFGHRTRKWNPRMKPYIFTERNGIHIIDLQQTVEALDGAFALVRDVVAVGGTILFVGTKRQAQETMQTEADRCGMAYVNVRWLGGTLTNWRTILKRIDELKALEKARDDGEFDKLSKKDALLRTRKIDRLRGRLGGLIAMRALPQLVYVVDVRREETAIHESNLLGIPVVALVDTNCDPSGVDYVIPSNDDAIRAIKLLTTKIADAVLEGKALRKDMPEEDEAAGEAPAERRRGAVPEDFADEDLLGEATLAKLQSGVYDEESGASVVEASEKADKDSVPEAEVSADKDSKPEAEVSAEKDLEPEAEAPADEGSPPEAEATAEKGGGAA